MHDVDEARVRDRILGCRLGTAIGGTLGQRFEGQEGPRMATERVIGCADPATGMWIPGCSEQLR
jgi:uncharacterized protein YcfJ